MTWLPRVAAMPWPNLNLASESLKLNLDLSKEKLAKLTSASKRLNAASRSFNSKLMRTRRSKLRRLKKLLPSTWPNSARLNKILRKLRRDARWLMSNFPLSVQAQLDCKSLKEDQSIHRFIHQFMASGSK